jgi:2-oxoglutarate ferredoxin oxidoreductase subunit beta
MAEATVKQSAKDFSADQDVRWCPGCGDYSVLANVQRVMPKLGVPRENFVFVSGIGCSSRFPYYMNTYGFHTIHGRAPAFATGIKLSRPDLSVWVVTGDGDGLSIGGNHLLHAIRRNMDIQILLFNNRVYGLTKGQYSPTSRFGMRTKSTPDGSIDYPIDPIAFALGAGATFVARTIDVDAPHLQEMLTRAFEHKGTAFVEILQNCPVFNDDEWIEVEDRKSRVEHAIKLQARRAAGLRERRAAQGHPDRGRDPHGGRAGRRGGSGGAGHRAARRVLRDPGLRLRPGQPAAARVTRRCSTTRSPPPSRHAAKATWRSSSPPETPGPSTPEAGRRLRTQPTSDGTFFARVSPISAGEGATTTPAASRAAILSEARPFPPAMMAPACPMRLPGGAFWPAMNATTGFFMWAWM